MSKKYPTIEIKFSTYPLKVAWWRNFTNQSAPQNANPEQEAACACARWQNLKCNTIRHWEGNHGNLQAFFLLQESRFFSHASDCAKNLGLLRFPQRNITILGSPNGAFSRYLGLQLDCGLRWRFIFRSTPLKVHKERCIRIKLLI